MVSPSTRAKLRHVTDAAPGITRDRTKAGFAYRGPDGDRVTDEETLVRIRSLVIPPAWEDVWITLEPRGHLQATGRDARGRKQYRYHELWRASRDESKFGNMVAFGQALPRLRRRVEEDLRRRGTPREKVVATVVRLLDVTGIRVGNAEYARENKSYGLTTFRTRHADVDTNGIVFTFRGKSGIERSIDVRDRRLARIVRQCKEIPGYELFQYLDEDGERRSVSSQDVNDYIREATGAQFTAKDFRTWWGTVLAATALAEATEPTSETRAKQEVAQAIKHVAGVLGNTPAVCRKAYVHPAVIEAYERDERMPSSRASRWLSAEERGTLALLRGCSPDGA
ncbi:MAG: DNA topoisomerase IB [Dehalococcoidia bacterium]|nr:DNA topoisomerase IB [Dehalococcoidia bacterium]